MKNEIFSINVKNGLYVGDLCYVLDDSVYYGIWGKANYKNGSYVDSTTGLEFAMVNTCYGDGDYYDNDGYGYSVDAGIIGICDTGLCTKGSGDYYGRLLQVKGEVTIEYENGDIYITPKDTRYNPITIQTDDTDDDEYYDDEYDDEYDDDTDEYDDEDE